MIAPRGGPPCLANLADRMEPEGGCLWIYDTVKNGLRVIATTAFMPSCWRSTKYAETAWVYYLNRPYSIGGMEDHIS